MIQPFKREDVIIPLHSSDYNGSAISISGIAISKLICVYNVHEQSLVTIFRNLRLCFRVGSLLAWLITYFVFYNRQTRQSLYLDRQWTASNIVHPEALNMTHVTIACFYFCLFYLLLLFQSKSNTQPCTASSLIFMQYFLFFLIQIKQN